jgi:hypothetical protein
METVEGSGCSSKQGLEAAASFGGGSKPWRRQEALEAIASSVEEVASFPKVVARSGGVARSGVGRILGKKSTEVWRRAAGIVTWRHGALKLSRGAVIWRYRCKGMERWKSAAGAVKQLWVLDIMPGPQCVPSSRVPSSCVPSSCVPSNRVPLRCLLSR